MNVHIKLGDLPVYSVSQVNGYIRDVLDGDGLLSGLLVRGEVSNYKKYPSGHHYFSLKDDQGTLRCVMFRGEAARLRFRPENGMRVVAFGRVSAYPRDGVYQLYCTELFTDGQGELNAAFERLKARLEAEGLFDEDAKRPLPRFPGKIALVTSPAGAAVRDMLRILKARWPLAAVVVASVRVQGEGAAEEIAGAIHALNNRADIDLIIAGRGGGSMEDLWAFNEEVVARAIYVSNIPVISAVGHEPDVTIADYAADLRAATPSNGAELAVPDRNELRQTVDQLRERLDRVLPERLGAQRQRLARLRSARVLREMRVPVRQRREGLEQLTRRMAAAAAGTVSEGRAELARRCAALEAMSPLKVLARGYAAVWTERGIVTSVEQVDRGDTLKLTLTDGQLRCVVEGKEKRTWRQKNS